MISFSQVTKRYPGGLEALRGVTLHVETIYGDNNHHIAESCFKALARSLREAIEIDPRQKNRIPSTKGSLKN